MCIYMNIYMCIYLYIYMYIRRYIWIYKCVYIGTYIYIYTYIHIPPCAIIEMAWSLLVALKKRILLVGLLFLYHPWRRSDLKHLDLQIGQFSCALFWVTGTPVYSLENWFEILGTPVKTCLKVTGTPVKTCWNFGSRNYFKSDLLRLWKVRRKQPF